MAMADIDSVDAKVSDMNAKLELVLTKIEELKSAASKELSAADAAKMVYAEAGNWVRMVNTITWTLGSIFLVGAIIATNVLTAQTSPWRGTVALWIIFLCLIWLLIDILYWVSIWTPRSILESVEKDFKNAALRLYTRQQMGYGNRVRFWVNVLTWVLPVVVGLFALIVGWADIKKSVGYIVGAIP